MTITRREILLAGAAAIAAQALSAAVASAEHHDHAAGAAAPSATPASALATAAGDCVEAGDACLQHCLDLLGKGDTSLAECAQNVRQMLAICNAVGPVAVADSKYLKKLAGVCIDVCTDCEKACRKHESHHAVCKACAEACERVVAAAKKVVG